MQSGSRPPTSGSSTTEALSDRRTRIRRWLLSYGLHVEILLALLLLVVAFVTIVVVLVGAVTALPTGPPPEGGESGTGGPSGIVDLGNLLLNGGLALTVGLGVFLVVHGTVELWTVVRTPPRRDLLDGGNLAYAGVRTVQTAAAVAFAGPILTGVTLSRLGVLSDDPSTTVLSVVFVCGVLMLVSVFAHAAGRAVRSSGET